jgi:hypothetical protein
MLENEGEEQFDRVCEKCWNINRVKQERTILHTMKRRKSNWIGHILRGNCLLKHVIERKVKGRGDEEEDLSSYWMTLRKREDTGN